jgi:hypothetical protein
MGTVALKDLEIPVSHFCVFRDNECDGLMPGWKYVYSLLEY